MNHQLIRRWLVGVSVLVGGVTGCTVAKLLPPLPPSPTAIEVTSPLDPDRLPQIKRYRSRLWAGKLDANNELPPIQDDAKHLLQLGDRVKTDVEGEGWLYLDGCQVIYLFQDGVLLKSPNTRKARTSGNATSLQQGTAIWNKHCASQVVMHTDSAEVRLIGTWVAVTYLPEQQLTVVMVFKGKTEIQAVQNRATETLTAPVAVPAGYFYFSQPGDRPASIANLSARTPHSFDRLPRLVAALNLWKWIPRMHDRARMDQIPFPQFLATECLIRTPADVTAWRLRSDPVNGEVIGSVPTGSQFLALARNVDAGWIFGATSQGLGWVPHQMACSANLSALPAISAQPSVVPQPAPEPRAESRPPQYEPLDEPPLEPEPEYPRRSQRWPSNPPTWPQPAPNEDGDRGKSDWPPPDPLPEPPPDPLPEPPPDPLPEPRPPSPQVSPPITQSDVNKFRKFINNPSPPSPR